MPFSLTSATMKFTSLLLVTLSMSLVTAQLPAGTSVEYTPREFLATGRDVSRSPSSVAGSISKQKCKEYNSRIRLDDGLLPGEEPALCPEKDDHISASLPFGGGIRPMARRYPNFALIGYDDEDKISWKCGGSLVSLQFVLTAAHCLVTRVGGTAKWVRVGELNLNETADGVKSQQVAVHTIITHPAFNHPEVYNDIGLLKLEKSLVQNAFVRPACLHTTFDIGSPVATVVGWSHSELDSSQENNHLLEVRTLIQSAEVCNTSYRDLTSNRRLKNGITEESMLCAGRIGGSKDTCNFQRVISGSPLQLAMDEPDCMYDIIGITSFSGSVCGTLPVVYTRVSHYLPWIERMVWPEEV